MAAVSHAIRPISGQRCRPGATIGQQFPNRCAMNDRSIALSLPSLFMSNSTRYGATVVFENACATCDRSIDDTNWSALTDAISYLSAQPSPSLSVSG
jgi:hypothetical protein